LMISLKESVVSMASPNPGVSTTVSLSLTPLSSISTVFESIWTVRFTLSAAVGMGLSVYRSVRKRLSIRVDLPSPLSPATIRVNSNPFFTDFLWTWLGRLAKPT